MAAGARTYGARTSPPDTVALTAATSVGALQRNCVPHARALGTTSRRPLSTSNATAWAHSAYIVVDTGPWIFGKEVLLPAGTVSRIDADDKKIFVDRTKEQIKNAPEFDKDKHLGNAEYHTQVGGYYGQNRA
ncbi:PRC-barrel domain-containing protein [Streptomyces sp. NPDC051577]|uniref:PRC-barrel domain-containing protein n=1 Tax=Streptomyces sp. NPDC051577 TaxID=3155166 RepID=UPI00344AC4A3